MSILSLLVDRATIRRATRAASSAGDIALGWTDVATDVPCRLETLEARERQNEGGTVLVSCLRATFAGDTDVRPARGASGADLVVVDSLRYRVAGVEDKSAGAGRVRVAILERLD